MSSKKPKTKKTTAASKSPFSINSSKVTNETPKKHNTKTKTYPNPLTIDPFLQSSKRLKSSISTAKTEPLQQNYHLQFLLLFHL
jgi:hypothetical protein